MCLDSGKILATINKSKTDNDVESSAAMETAGTRALLKSILDPYTDDDEPLALWKKKEAQQQQPSTSSSSMDSPDFFIPAPESAVQPLPLRVKLLITDENQSVMKMVREEFPNLVHEADPWHLRKSILKKLLAAAGKRRNALLMKWIPSIKNWLWTAMKSCNGDGELLVEFWRSMAYHIRGQHSWKDDASYSKYHQCPHKDLSSANIAFLPIESDAYTAFMEIVEDVSIHNRLRRCTSFLQTSLLESFHSLLCKYLPKDLRFTGVAFDVRSKLAIIDWNENVDRPLCIDENGGERLTFSHPAAANDWRARKLRVDRCHNWRMDIISGLADFACDKWKSGHHLSHNTGLITHLPLVNMYEPLDRVTVAARLYRNP